MNPTQLTNAVTAFNGQVTTTSLKIAEVFGKDHKNVIRDIEKLQVIDGFGKLNFEPTEYEWKNNLGKIVKSPMYVVTKDGFTLLAMGFTGAKAMQFKIAYIEAFNRMEAALRKSSNDIVSRLAEEIRRHAEAQVMRDIAGLRKVVCDYLHDAGYTINGSLLAALPLTGETNSPEMQTQCINHLIRRMVDPKLIASVKIQLGE